MAATLTLLLVAYGETLQGMVAIWLRSDTFMHGFIVPPITAWLIWRQRHVLATLQPRPAPLWLIPLTLTAAVWLLGNLTQTNSITQLAVTALIVLSVPSLLGAAVLKAILFPLVFLFFAVPIGEFLLPWLMSWTADFTIATLRASRVPVYREGLQFVIPSGNWSVVEACSGIRYLIASVMVGTLFAYLNFVSPLRRLIFFLTAIIVPILANWLRAYLIVIIGHLSGNRLAAGVDHLIYGWVFFGVVISLMFLVGARWAETPPERAPQPNSSTPGEKPASTARLFRVFVMLAALLLLPHALILSTQSSATAPASTLGAINAANWQVTEAPAISWKPAFQNPAQEKQWGFSNAQNQQITLYVTYYRAQHATSKLISSENVLVKSYDAQWAQVSSSSFQTNIAGQQISMASAEIKRLASSGIADHDGLLVWQCYWVAGRLTTSPYLAKLYGAWQQLTSSSDDSAILVLSTPLSQRDSTNSADSVLAEFLGQNTASILTMLNQAKQMNAEGKR